MTPPKHKPHIEIAGVPDWLIAGGINSLLLILISLAVAGVLYLFNLTAAITVPLLIAFVIAVIAFPLIKLGDKLRFPRALSSLIVVVLVFVLATASIQITAMGVIKQAPDIGQQLVKGLTSLGSSADKFLLDSGMSQDQIDGVLNNALDSIKSSLPFMNSQAPASSGTETTSSGTTTTSSSTTASPVTNKPSSGLLTSVFSGLANGISGLVGFLGGLAGAAFSLFIGAMLLYYVLSDFEIVTEWVGKNLGVEKEVGAGLVSDAFSSLRGYFRGTTLTAIVVALGVGAGLLILGVPLIIPIMIVTFLTAYIPFFGAIISGAFACLIALGSGGLAEAFWAVVIVLVAQNVLQSIVNAKFMGDSLDLHPIAVLAITIVGSIFGGLLGATLAAPMLAMAIRAKKRLSLARCLLDEGETVGGVENAMKALNEARKHHRGPNHATEHKV